MPNNLRRGLAPGLLAVLAVCQPACSKKETSGPVKEPEWGQKVSGKVTHKGQPVPYGYVLFFSRDKSFDPKSGQVVASASARINSDGSYEAANVPTGPVAVCLAT